MSKCLLLDCTLRDGGYINNWEFGDKAIYDICSKLEDAGVDILELGFLRDETYSPNRVVWNDIQLADKYISKKDSNRLYAVMGEIFNPFPLEKLKPKSETSIDIIRIIVWKRLIPEALNYCKAIIDKGYKLCVQPDRVNQYTLEEFKDMVSKFAAINPYAIYVVDSNGLLCKKRLLEYLNTADSVLSKNIKLGYHGHNNLLQAVGTAESFRELELDRDIIIDGTVRGIGRSSGNLNIELFAKYLNDNFKTNYKIRNFIEIYDKYIHSIYEKSQWGYSMETFITAYHDCNPNYAYILKNDYHLTAREIFDVISLFSEKDKVITNRDAIQSYIDKYRNMK